MFFGFFLSLYFNFSIPWKITFPIIIVGICFFIGLVIISKKIYECTYLGDKGLVRYIMRNNDNIKQSILVFNPDMELASSVSEQFDLGFNFFTDYFFNWFQNDKLIFNIVGSKDYDFEVGKKTELNWIKFLYENKVLIDIEKKGSYQFHSSILFSEKSISFVDSNGKKIIIDNLKIQNLRIRPVALKTYNSTIQVPYLAFLDSENNSYIPFARMTSIWEGGVEKNCKLILYFIEKQFNKNF